MAQTTTIELRGDRVVARSLSEAHTTRLLGIFRKNNSFQNLDTNTVRHSFYDNHGAQIGEMILNTSFGVETITVTGGSVKQKQGKQEKRKEKPPIAPDMMVIPMLRVWDAPAGEPIGWAIYYNGRLEEGKCFFYPFDPTVENPADMGINYVVLAEQIMMRRLPQYDEETGTLVGSPLCEPMYINKNYDRYLWVDYSFGDDLFPVCFQEYTHIDSFYTDIAGLTDTKWYAGESVKDFILNRWPEATGCDTFPVSGTLGLLRGKFDWYRPWAETRTIWITDDVSEVVPWSAKEDVTEAETKEAHFDQANFFFERFANTYPHNFWQVEFYPNYNEDSDLYYQQAHCPELDEMGYWPAQTAPNTINYTGDGSGMMLMFTWADSENTTYTHSPWADKLMATDGWVPAYDPEIDIMVTGRFSCSHAQDVRENIAIETHCDTAGWGTSISHRYFYIDDYDWVTTWSASLSGTLSLNGSETIHSFEYSSYVSGGSFSGGIGSYFNWPEDLMAVQTAGATFLYEKAQRDNGLFHSANFAAGAISIEDPTDPEYDALVECGAIAFASTENGCEKSYLLFTDIPRENALAWSTMLGMGTNGVWPVLKMEGDTEGYVLLTPFEAYAIDWNTITKQDYFVVRYTKV